MSLSSLATAHQIDSNMQEKLMSGGNKYSFDFRNDFEVDALKNLIEGEIKIKVLIDPSVEVKRISHLHLQNVSFLDYLYQGADSLNLKAVQQGKNQILLVPKY